MNTIEQTSRVAGATATCNAGRAGVWPPLLRRAIACACLLSAAGGLLDGWIYVGHGGVFANAQTGNIVLGAIALAAGDFAEALKHLPSLLAFCSGLVLSRWCAARLAARGLNSRTSRLVAEALALALLAVYAARLCNEVTTAVVGFIAAWQITALSTIRGWSFNTGMTTGNLMSAISAASTAWSDRRNVDARVQATALGLMCVAFVAGATVGAVLTHAAGDVTSLVGAATVLSAAAIARDLPDPASGQSL